jgi:hypothetical protein
MLKNWQALPEHISLPLTSLFGLSQQQQQQQQRFKQSAAAQSVFTGRLMISMTVAGQA